MNNTIYKFQIGFLRCLSAFVFALHEQFYFFDTMVCRPGDNLYYQLFGNKHGLVFFAVIPGQKQIAHHK